MKRAEEPFQDPEWVRSYEEGPPRFVPGYRSLQIMACVLLAESLGPAGRVLVLGAGGGAELEVFTRLQPDWRFVAVDSSPLMLARAKQRMAAIGATERVEWSEASLSQAPVEEFDGATCLLTLPFLPDDGTRLRSLRHVRSCLRTRAPLVTAHLAFDPKGPGAERSQKRYADFALASGADPELVAQAQKQMLSGLTLLSPERERELLRKAGFAKTEIFYRGFDWTGWVSYA
ncbi:MAG: class I SAM-dependent methyltransferase [Candidatus Eremiobacteraeota bacterium]|nr:class I SAM-dependent methyltransferase [Candidatus Eremiobacteraeota bacterium]MCW5866929.1 class I SAM-dependent methyltransferase [Candidatus Eremiobacteraeota bacterium]